jgi:hypothetical protein
MKPLNVNLYEEDACSHCNEALKKFYEELDNLPTGINAIDEGAALIFTKDVDKSEKYHLTFARVKFMPTKMVGEKAVEGYWLEDWVNPR